MTEKKSLQSQATEILQKAEERGVQSNFFFVTTFKRYQVQMQILRDLEEAIKDHGTTVTKTYVKGRENLVVNPAITEYNKTATAANGTVAALINVIRSLPEEEQKSSKLQSLIASLSDE